MTELIFFGKLELTEIVKMKFLAESVEFDHDSEFLPDCHDGIFVVIERIDGEESEAELDWLDFSQVVEDHIKSLGYMIVGIRYFTCFEGFGVVAMVKKV
jgi:hypothetical protein